MLKHLSFIIMAGVCPFLSFSSLEAKEDFPASHPFSSSNNKWKNYQSKVLSYQSQIPGWCSLEKAAAMMDLIYEVRPEICVEIGVFGGSSIYPTASALKFLQHGKVYAIDPWKTSPCLEGYAPENANYQWWGQVNLEQIYLGFIEMLRKFQILSYCEVFRMRSDESLDLFVDNSIDILHIDGNHTEDVAISDAQMYLPKVKKGGYIWFDDINWATTGPAVAFLSLYCTRDEQRSTKEYCLFIKN